MSLTLAAEPPPLTADEHGRIRVAGTRVFLELLVRAYQRGTSAEQIAARYDSLALADVYGALRFYLTHRAEVDEYIAHQAADADVLKSEILATQSSFPTRTELLTRRSFRPGDRVPVSGLWRCQGGLSRQIALSAGETFPPCGDGPRDSSWTCVPTGRSVHDP